MLLILISSLELSAGSILFDYTKDETAGNADWIIDNNWPQPLPDNPNSPEDWIGAISSWGYALQQLGHRVRTLPPGHSITYGNSSDSLDLIYFDVFVLCEPQNPLSEQEIQAIIQFTSNGGGLFLVANHYSSDRNNNGWDSPRIFNAAGFDTIFGIHFNVSGEPYNNLWDSPDSNVSNDPSDPIIHGPLGDVGAIGYYAGTAMTLYVNYNPYATGHVWATGAPQGTNYVTLATSRYGLGKIVGLGDSSPVDDGTGNPGNNLYNGWTAVGEDNNIAVLNATLWLLGLTGNTPPLILEINQIPEFPSPLDTVIIIARISDDGTISTSEIHYRIQENQWQIGYPDSIESDFYYYSIPPYPAGTTVEYFIIATDDSSATTVSDTFNYTVLSSGLNISGYMLIQENSHREYVFGDITIPDNGLLIISRNSNQTEFESFWGVTLDTNVIFVNSDGHMPIINGDEVYTLVDSSGDTLEGPTVPMETGITMQRISEESAGLPQSWDILPDSEATPGSTPLQPGIGSLFISEISDASGTGNYIYEFIELYYSATTDVSESPFNPRDTRLTIFPNPSKGLIFIESSNSPELISIYDVTGKLTYRKLLRKKSMLIDLRRLGVGFYFLKAGNKVRRLVIIR